MKVLNSPSVIPINLAEAYLTVPVSTAGKILLSAHPLDCQTNYPARSRATSSRPTAAATSNRHLLALDVQLLPLHNVLHPAPLLHVLLLLLSQLHPQHPHNPRCSQPSCLLALLVTLYFSSQRHREYLDPAAHVWLRTEEVVTGQPSSRPHQLTQRASTTPSPTYLMPHPAPRKIRNRTNIPGDALRTYKQVRDKVLKSSLATRQARMDIKTSESTWARRQKIPVPL